MIDELIGESGRDRGHFNSQILTPALRKAAKELKNNEDIIVRKADKSAIFVIMNREEYNQKMDNILADRSKFEPLQRDPTDAFKRKSLQLD